MSLVLVAIPSSSIELCVSTVISGLSSSQFYTNSSVINELVQL